MIEWVWRAIMAALILFSWRFCACAVWVYFSIREAGVDDIWSLKRYHERQKAMSREERSEQARRLFPLWFRIIFLWRL